MTQRYCLLVTCVEPLAAIRETTGGHGHQTGCPDTENARFQVAPHIPYNCKVLSLKRRLITEGRNHRVFMKRKKRPLKRNMAICQQTTHVPTEIPELYGEQICKCFPLCSALLMTVILCHYPSRDLTFFLVSCRQWLMMIPKAATCVCQALVMSTKLLLW